MPVPNTSVGMILFSYNKEKICYDGLQITNTGISLGIVKYFNTISSIQIMIFKLYESVIFIRYMQFYLHILLIK